MENIRRIPDPRCDGVISKDPLEHRNVIPPAPKPPEFKTQNDEEEDTGGDGPTRPK